MAEAGHKGRAPTVICLRRSNSRLCWCAEHWNLPTRTEERNRNEHSIISIFQEKPLIRRSMGCGLHARVPQLNPLPDAVHRTINGTSMEGAVAMALGAPYFACEGEGRWKKKARQKHITCLTLNRQSSARRRALCRQRYVDRTGGEEVGRCSNTCVANEITCDGHWTCSLFFLLPSLSF